MDASNQGGCLGRAAWALGVALGLLVVIPFAIPVLGAVAGSGAILLGMVITGAVVMIPLGLLLRGRRR